jgi:hypothetical protein
METFLLGTQTQKERVGTGTRRSQGNTLNM